MGDVVALYVAAVVCQVAFVVVQVRADARAGTSADPGWRGWLLVACAVVCVVSASGLVLSRLFGG